MDGDWVREIKTYLRHESDALLHAWAVLTDKAVQQELV